MDRYTIHIYEIIPSTEKVDREKACSLKLLGSVDMQWNWPGGYLKHRGKYSFTQYIPQDMEYHKMWWESLFCLPLKVRKCKSRKRSCNDFHVLSSLPGKMFLHFSQARSCDRHSHLGFTKLRLKIWSHKLSNLSRNTELPDTLSFFTLSETLLHLALPCSVCLASSKFHFTLPRFAWSLPLDQRLTWMAIKQLRNYLLWPDQSAI